MTETQQKLINEILNLIPTERENGSETWYVSELRDAEIVSEIGTEAILADLDDKRMLTDAIHEAFKKLQIEQLRECTDFYIEAKISDRTLEALWKTSYEPSSLIWDEVCDLATLVNIGISAKLTRFGTPEHLRAKEAEDWCWSMYHAASVAYAKKQGYE